MGIRDAPPSRRKGEDSAESQDGDKLVEFAAGQRAWRIRSGGAGLQMRSGSGWGWVARATVGPRRELGFYSELAGKPWTFLTSDGHNLIGI